VHRDVKPANVLVDREGGACLTDFGIATATGDSSLTTGGALIGSPSYMAPERANGEQPRPEVDLWSLGATLYAAVEGRPPFDKGEAMATLMSVVSEPPAPMLRAGPLAPVLTGLLTKDPARRATLEQARRDLSAVLAGRGPAGSPPPSPPPAAPPRQPAAAPPRQPAAGPPRQPAAASSHRPAAARHPLPGGSVERIDGDDLRALASASRALLGSVARDARDVLADRRRERKEAERRPASSSGGGRVAAPPRRRRFKRRWVVVPLVVTVLLTVLVVAAVALGVLAVLGLL
jgi:hypothetical protein